MLALIANIYDNYVQKILLENVASLCFCLSFLPEIKVSTSVDQMAQPAVH